MSEKTIQFKTGDALLIVDMQNDFCPGGALAIDKGDTIIPVLNKWIHEAQTRHIPIFASRDWHPFDHVSFKDQGGLWPPHCIQDTLGAKFHAALNVSDNIIVVTKGTRFDHDQNSAFADTGLEIYLRQKGINRLFIGGLALDVCVLDTILDARKFGFKVVLIKDGSLSVTEEGEKTAMKYLKNANVDMVETLTDKIENENPENRNKDAADMDFCRLAPEWAEHARPNAMTDACDDGRAWEAE